jgi:proton glutamate symport protein
MFLLRMPLHYQILLAMVLGSIIGLMVNPGEQQLKEAQVIVEPTDEGGIRLTEVEPDGRTGLTESFASAEDFQRRYKKAAEALLSDPPQRKTADVVNRRLHISEETGVITMRYTRQYDGDRIVSSLKAQDPEELRQNYPQFAGNYETYAGTFSRKVSITAKTVGDLFLRLLRMITIPLIITSLVVGVAGLGSTERIGSMFGKTLLYYLATSTLAIATGILLVNVIRPGIGAELPGGGEGVISGEEQSLPSIFLGLLNNMIPPNPIEAMAKGDFLAIITFSILTGLFIIKVGGESGKTMRNFFQAAFDVMMEMTLFIIRLAPIGVFAFILFATASQGLEVFKTFALYMLTVFLALMVHACVVLPLILYFVARQSPWKYFQALSPALMTAFSTASSNGTLPLTMTCVEERARIPNRITSFVLPLGATINMDGTALYEAVAVLFIAQAYNGFVMPVEQQILVAVTALLASVGAAGIPSAGLVMMAIVLQAVGLPLDAQGLIIAVDRVLDMCRTAVNVWSDSCGCAVLARFDPAPDAALIQADSTATADSPT